MQTIKYYQEQAQQTVDKVINIAEVQYNALSSVAFTYAGKLTNVLSIKGSHDKISYMAYGKAREFNKLIGETTGELILKIEKPQTKTSKAKAAANKVVATVKNNATTAKATTDKVSKIVVEKIEEARS